VDSAFSYVRGVEDLMADIELLGAADCLVQEITSAVHDGLD
jgi:hypothetical protein